MKLVSIILSLVFATSACSYKFPSPNEPSGKLIFIHTKPAKQLFPVTLLEVNGENVSPRSEVVWLSPGEYDLKFSAQVDSKYTQQLLSQSQIRGSKDWDSTLKIKVEADKSYNIGFDASAAKTEDWKIVVYKTAYFK